MKIHSPSVCILSHAADPPATPDPDVSPASPERAGSSHPRARTASLHGTAATGTQARPLVAPQTLDAHLGGALAAPGGTSLDESSGASGGASTGEETAGQPARSTIEAAATPARAAHGLATAASGPAAAPLAPQPPPESPTLPTGQRRGKAAVLMGALVIWIVAVVGMLMVQIFSRRGSGMDHDDTSETLDSQQHREKRQEEAPGVH